MSAFGRAALKPLRRSGPRSVLIQGIETTASPESAPMTSVSPPGRTIWIACSTVSGRPITSKA